MFYSKNIIIRIFHLLPFLLLFFLHPLMKNFTYLKQAVNSNDIQYIHDHLNSETLHNELKMLTIEEKSSLLYILKHNLDSFGLSKEILKLALEIIKNTNHMDMNEAVDSFCKGLGRKTSEIGKMHYLKGKLEYLKWKGNKHQFVKKEPENVIVTNLNIEIDDDLHHKPAEMEIVSEDNKKNIIEEIESSNDK